MLKVSLGLDEAVAELRRTRDELDQILQQFRLAAEDDAVEVRIGNNVFRRVHVLPVTTPREILDIVAGHYDMDVEELLSQSRHARVLLPRQVAMYLMRERLGMSFRSIAETTGRFDHTTAITAHRKIGQLVATRVPEGRKVLRIIDELNERKNEGST